MRETTKYLSATVSRVRSRIPPPAQPASSYKSTLLRFTGESAGKTIVAIYLLPYDPKSRSRWWSETDREEK